ncbi:ligand-dependent nuclear receptor-interacting factor 1 isoform X2 [Cavia porcellus]|uniref:Ligand dependent nuclear receptor interacting factor 1 n=2 Tax=Cavia porcellus TaxID=10141 RepID=A0A286XWH5_CAVPO
MASVLENHTQESKDVKESEESTNKALYLKSDTEFRKIFGLTKDVRVCLTRIPDHLDCGKGFDYLSSLVTDGTYRKTEFVVKEEKNKQSCGKKRKAKTTKKMDHTKKRKTESAFNTVINGEANVTSESLNNILPTSDIPQYNILPSPSKTGEEKRTNIKHYSQGQQEKVASNSNVIFEQSYSFSKNYTEDIFPATPPELEETIRDEKIRRLKQVLREKEAALEEMRKKMQQK